MFNCLKFWIGKKGGTYEKDSNSCGKAVGNACTGSSCMKAMNCRKGTFARYESEEIELQAFFQCSGCGDDLEHNSGLQEKVEHFEN